MEKKTGSVQVFKLMPKWELRFKSEARNEKFTLELKSGLGEVFGTELRKNKKYEFTSDADNFARAVFTWHGCTVELAGKVHAYISKETPMERYLYCHTAMEALRDHADENNTRGPVFMIAGSPGAGKTTLSRILTNYSARSGRTPIYVDLNCAQGQVGLPGTIGALLVGGTADVVDGFNQAAPMMFHYGHTDPNSNLPLYKLLVTRLAEACSKRLLSDKKDSVSGVIINTCGLSATNGTEILTHIARAFEVDAMIVLGAQEIHHRLRGEISDVKVITLPVSGGAEDKGEVERYRIKTRLVNEYFHGSAGKPLYPYKFQLKWDEVKLFRIGRPASPGTQEDMAAEDCTKLIEVAEGPRLYYRLLSVPCVDSPTEDIVKSNVTHFVLITEVDNKRQTYTFLSSQPASLMKRTLLYNEFAAPMIDD